MTGIPRGDLTPDWVDHVAIDRALTGKPVGRRLHRAERRHIARQLVADGHGPSLLATVTGCAAREATELVEEVRSCSD